MTQSTDRRRHAAWLVDLDGTLYVPGPVKAAMAAELLVSGWNAIGPLREFRRQHERLRSEQAGDNDSPYALQVLQAARRKSIPAERMETLIEKWMRRRPGKWLYTFRRRQLFAEIEAFRDAGGRTAVVSDYPASIKLRSMKAEALFDVIVANGESNGPRYLKPHPEGLLLAAKQLSVEPKQCLVIGDRLDVDGEAAAAAGMDFRLIR